MRLAALSSNDGAFGLAIALVLAALMTGGSGCALFALEPPCRNDDNCEEPRRCHVENGVCVDAPPPPPDAGADDAGGDTSLNDAG